MSEVRPEHYGGEENPFEPRKIIEHYDLGFHLGNVVKYVLRAGKKAGVDEIEDLEKAATYLQFQIRYRKIRLINEERNANPQIQICYPDEPPGRDLRG